MQKQRQQVFKGTSRVIGIYRGTVPIYGLLVNSKRWPGGVGSIVMSCRISGSSQTIDYGKTSIDVDVSSGWTLAVSGGSASISYVHSGGILNVGWDRSLPECPTPGIAAYVQVQGHGKLYVSSGCSALHIDRRLHGHVEVEDGGYVTYR